MWTGITLGLAAAFGAFFMVVYRRLRAQISALESARAKIQLEETRVFDFLHGLGTALSDDARQDDLHRLIVEGAMRILDAHGGALYLADERSGQLRPAFISKECPALFEVPAQYGDVVKHFRLLSHDAAEAAFLEYVHSRGIDPKRIRGWSAV